MPSLPNQREGIPLSVEPKPAVLPQPVLRASSQSALLESDKFQLDEIFIRGATVFAPDEFEIILSRYRGQLLDFGQLQKLRDELTLMYVDAGYLTSGVVVQSLTNGVLTVDVIEGGLTEILVEQSSSHRADYVRGYLAGFGSLQPVNIFDVEERLQMLQADAHVQRIEAQLRPGNQRGESILWVDNQDVSPIQVMLEANNHLAPALGDSQLLATFDYLNLRGRSDDLHLGLRSSEGLTQFSLSYQFPLNYRDTRLTAYGFGSESEVVAEPYDELDIEASSRTYGLRIDQPLVRSLVRQSALYMSAEWRESNTDLLGFGFSFVEGPDNGEVRLAVVRTGWDFVQRSPNSVLAGRAQVSFGLDAFQTTQAESISGARVPEPDFVVFLGQLQWAKRLQFLASRVTTRLDIQWADGPLFGVEQMPIGGRWSVRGYRENSLIRDSGVVASVDWRVPLDLGPGGDRWGDGLEVGIFADWSHSWNDDRDEIGPVNIYSLGVGLTWKPLANTELEVVWGHAFVDLDNPGDNRLQDQGVHARLRWRMP